MTDHQAIRQAIQSFAASYNSGNLTALLSYYDDDLVRVRQGAPAESKAETERRVKDVFARFDTRVDVDNLEIEVSGDMAFTRGVFTVTLSTREGGDTRQVVRRYLEVWRKRAGLWRVARTMAMRQVQKAAQQGDAFRNPATRRRLGSVEQGAATDGARAPEIGHTVGGRLPSRAGRTKSEGGS